MKQIFGAAILLAALAAGAARAAPAEIADTIHSDKPHGEGAVRFLVLTAYRAALWTDAPAWSMNAPFALSITYGMGFDSDDLVDRSLADMKHVDPGLGDAELGQFRRQLAQVFPAVRSGDRITALFVPKKPVSFFKNGTATGSIDGSVFARDFFGIWLSPRTSDPGLRGRLLAAGASRP